MLAGTSIMQAQFQDSLRRDLMISIRAGLSLPVVKYEQPPDAKEVNLSGKANDGYAVQMMLSRFLMGRGQTVLGLHAGVFVTANGSSGQGIYLGDPGRPGLGGGSVTTSSQLSSGTYRGTSFMGGGSIRNGGSKNWIQLRLMFGIQHMSVPQVTLERQGYVWTLMGPEHYPWAATWEQPAFSDYVPAFDAGFDFGFTLSGRWGALFGLEYQYAQSRFQGEWSYRSDGSDPWGESHYQWTEKHGLTLNAGLLLAQLGFSCALR